MEEVGRVALLKDSQKGSPLPHGWSQPRPLIRNIPSLSPSLHLSLWLCLSLLSFLSPFLPHWWYGLYGTLNVKNWMFVCLFVFSLQMYCGFEKISKRAAPGTCLYHQYHPSKIYYMNNMPKLPWIPPRNDAFSIAKHSPKALVFCIK